MEGEQGRAYAEDMGTYGDALARCRRRQPVADHHRPQADIGQRDCVSYPLADAMSQHQVFKRVPVNPQVVTKLETLTFPAPTRGLVLSENESYMQPGAAMVMDNWVPTMKGAKLRGGCMIGGRNCRRRRR